MKKNGRTAKGVQRWKRPDCSLSPTMPQERAAHARVPGEFLARLPGRQPQCALDPSGDSPALRKRTAWCWNIHPSIPPVTARHHTVMADGTCMGHGWCLIIAIDGESGETLGFQWCGHESKAAYTALFSRMPAPDVPITDGLRGAEAACQEAWPGTRIQRCLAHVQRNTRTDLTSKPKLEAGGQLKKLSDRLTKAHDGETAVKWGEALNAWHITWGVVHQRTHPCEGRSNQSEGNETAMAVDPRGRATLPPEIGEAVPGGQAVRVPRPRPPPPAGRWRAPRTDWKAASTRRSSTCSSTTTDRPRSTRDAPANGCAT